MRVPTCSGGSVRVVTYLKWPRALHYRTRMVLLGEDDAGIWLGTRRGNQIESPSSPTSPGASQDSITLFPRKLGWSARWYSERATVGRASKYCTYVDITTPPEVSETDVQLVDLDLDVVKTWDGEVALLDEDEFEHNRLARGYPVRVVRDALKSESNVREALLGHTFPFDGSAQPYMDMWFRLDQSLAEEGAETRRT
ncbi:hypothetical protein GCM10023317_24990 [Actinopolymorpha pittospori]